MDKLFWIADDDADDRMIIRDAFEENKFSKNLQFFEDGEMVLNKFNEYPSGVALKRPLLLILDLNMPKVNGLELLTRLKKSKKTKNIPIVILSTSKSPFDREKVIELGADEFITKPFSFDAMIEITRDLIKKYG